MSTKPQTADDSTEPEYTNVELRAVANDLLDLCDDEFDLDRHVDSLHVAQLDEPWCDDSDEVRMMIDTDAGSTKAELINAVMASDLPLELDDVCPDHEQIAFHVTA